jgi:hypothetical protein
MRAERGVAQKLRQSRGGREQGAAQFRHEFSVAGESACQKQNYALQFSSFQDPTILVADRRLSGAEHREEFA